MTATVTSIINFLEQRASTNQLTGQQITSLIVDLKAQINELSVSVPNADASAVTVLYSGQMGNGVHTGTVAEALVSANPGKVLTINQTEVYRLLRSDNDAFHSALRAALGADSDAVYNSLIDGSIANGTRVPDSLWDDASRSFAQNATGDVRVIAPDGDTFKIFAQTELPALLDNPKVTHIDGIPREQLVALRDTKGLAAVQQFTFDNSRLKAVIGGLAQGEFQKYLDLTPDTYGEALKDISKYDAVNEMLDGMDEARKAQFRNSMRTAFYLGEDWAAKGLSKAANKLGPLGILAGFLFAANSASAAEAKGDSEQAKEIMTQWAVDASGSGIGEAAGTTIGGIAAAALAATGVVLSAPLAGAIIMGAALIGGIFGGDGATGLYELFKDKDENGRRDIIDKLGNLLFGADFSITTALPDDLNGDRLTLDTTFSREDIVSNAKTDIAWRYALRELNPFVVPDISYDRHNTDGSLDLYDPFTGQGAITELYLQDRAAMLTWKIRYDRGLQATDTRTIQGDWDFVDYSIQAGGAPLTLAIEGNGISIFDHQIVFGSKHADTLEGSGDSDHLFGSGGDDILTGQGGNDYLEGGSGNDTYIFYADDGFDTLLDTDGLGKIQWDGLEIKGSNTGGLDPAQWQQLNNTFWQDQANHIVYTLKAQADGSKTLFINKEGGQLRVDHWVEGNLGITLGAVNGVTTAIHIYNGDQRAPLIGSEIDLTVPSNNSSFNTFKWSATSWAADGTLTGGIVQADFNDVIAGSSEADSINGLGGNDALDGRAGNDVLDGGAGDDLIAGGAGSDVIYGGSGNDMILSATGLDVAQRTGPRDTWQTPYGKTVWIKGSNWGVADASGLYNYTISGGASLTPDNAPDIIFAGAGDDRVIGGLGDDYMDGGLGNDLLVGHGGSDILDSGDGDDFMQGDGKVNPGYYESVAGDNHGNDYLDGGAGADTLLGGGKHDVLFGGSGNDLLWGDETYLPGQFHGSDYLDGGDGDDQLVGGGMDDTLIGGEGKDTLYGDDVITVLAGIFHGNDTLDGGDSNDVLFGGGKDDTLFGGTGDDILWGDEESETYLPGQYHGKDHLDGGEGNDYMVGAGNDDILIGGEGDDTLIGDDEMSLAVQYHGNDILDGGDGDDALVGNSGDDILLGGAGIDLLWGGEGNDILEGGDGDDLSSVYGNAAGEVGLSGGSGDDRIYGGSGRDELDGGEGFDLLDGGTDDDLLFGGSGDDTLYGGDGNDNLYGDSGNDILEGGAGADYLAGGFGDDIYLNVTAEDTVFDNEGTDTIQTSMTYTLNAYLDNLTLTGTKAINGIGNANNNILTGNSAINILAGGAGDDTYVIGIDDVVVEMSGEGADTVQSGISYTLAGNVENLTLTGIAAINGTGNSLNNVLIGNSAANTLIGGGGADRLIGGNGDDTYVVDNTLASVTEAPNEGADTVQSSITFTLSANVENLILTGTAAINGTGNQLNNSLTGNAADNVLYGGFGNDILNGGPGADTLIGGLGADHLYGGEGDDILYGLFEPVGGTDESSVLTPTVYRYLYESGNALVDGLGESGYGKLVGFGENYLSRNDDQSSGSIDITPIMGADGLNFFGQRYTKLFVNNNGNITFNSELDEYTPSQIGSGSVPIIAPFWADVDTRAGGGVTTPGGNSKGTNLTYYDLDAVNGVMTVTWDDVGYYNYGMDKLNAVQLQVVNRGGGDFDLIFRYEAVNWISGNASDGVEGLGGTVARAGYSAGDGNPLHYYELPESGNQEHMLALDSTPGNTGRTGSHVFHVRNGTPIADTYSAIRNGDTGVNLLYGGIGNDVYIVDNPGDVVVEFVDEGTDHVKASVSYVLPDDVEKLTLTGTANINGSGNALDNVLMGNAGANILAGGEGDDTYAFNRGDGIDTILDSGVQDANCIQFGQGILPVDIVYDWEGSTLVLNYGLGDTVRIPDFDCAGINGSPVVLTMAFEDGAVISLAEFLNRAPVAGEAISAPDAVEDLDYQFTVPVDAFTDPDSGDLLSYVDSLADGRPLPSWLVFNAFTQTFSGTPGNEQVGGLDIALEARDMHGLSAAQTFRLEVRNVNDAPVAMAPISPRTLLEDEPFFYSLPDAMFVDEDAGDSLTYSATLADSSLLPSWLSFEGATRTFSGTPGNADVGDVAIWVAATDQAGASATSVFNLTIQNVNDAPFVSTPIADRNTKQGQAFQYTLPTNTFADRDAGDRLSYAAKLEDGKPLPAWLTFDNSTLTFASTRGIPDAGNFNIRVTATDQAGAEVSDSFTLNVSRGYNEINGAPGKLILKGTSANDRIDGKSWISIMTGRGGDDLYIIDNHVEFVVELAGEGVDTVEASVGYQLPQFVENLILTGSKAINGVGNGLDNLLVGNSAANTLNGLIGNDILNGGDGNDQLYGDNGDDILDGGLGNDSLLGGAGNDTYLFGRGSGADVVSDFNATAGNTDVLSVGSGVASDQLWFRQAGSDLEVSIIGTTDKSTISNWYSGNANHIEQFKTANGKMLLDSQVDALVSAMAAFAPPAAGQTSLPPDYQAALAPVIAANWK